jgi:hypothetical protein
VIASDSHDATHRPPDPRLGDQVLLERYGDAEEQIEWMTVSAPGALVAGEPLPERPALPRARGFTARLRSWSAR